MKQVTMQAFLIALIVAASADIDIDWTKVRPLDAVPMKMRKAKANVETTRILGGTEAPRNHFPFMTGLLIYVGMWPGWCGGSLVSEEWVLTAAHCVYNKKTSRVIVFLGYHKISEDAPGTLKFSVKAANIKRHIEYNNDEITNDIAMIKFDKKVALTDNIQVIPLINDPTICPDGSPVSAIGWGKTSGNAAQRSNILLYINTTVLDMKSCKAQMSDMPNDTNICIDGSEGKSACFGDSGGPLIFTKPDGERILVGLTSFGAAGCPVGVPTVYTRISSYLDWIETTSGIKPKN